MITFDSNQWGLIIGGSSGFGLATARKLARHGMNICIVHRDRRRVARQVEPEFESIRALGVELVALNADALSPDARSTMLGTLSDRMAGTGRVKVLLHSIAFGNLKLLTPYPDSDRPRPEWNRLARILDTTPEKIQAALEEIFSEQGDAAHALTTPPAYNNRQLLDSADFSRTVYAMGTSLVDWVQDVFARRLFADDARILGLTSQGNATAWRGYAAVSAAKAALEAVSRSLALEFAPYGIRSNIIQAGITDTPALRAIPGHQQMMAHARLRNPFGRLTTPEDVARVVFLLCLPEAGWINGALICADGGERIA